ncbi:MAG: EamA family transporter [Sterolibacteriaceae bacterium MAG5]|nr:EamA family transporter [Candidatus Nitricoxidireducens bremensis]
MSRDPRSGRALAALVLLTLIWGYTWVVAKLSLDYAGPFTVGALRAGAGTLALFAALVAVRRSLRLTAPLKTACIGIFQTGGFIALSTWALVEGGAGKTAVLIFTMPIWTLLLARLVLGERIRGTQWIAAASALAGLVLVIAPWHLEASPLSKGLAVLAAVSWALSTILVKRWRGSLSADVLSLTAWQMVFGSALLFVIAALVPERATQWEPAFAGILAFMALVSTALGWFLWLYVLEHLPAWQASLSILGIPAVAGLSSRLQLGETVAAGELAGMLLIGVGLLLMSLLNWRAQRRLRQEG